MIGARGLGKNLDVKVSQHVKPKRPSCCLDAYVRLGRSIMRGWAIQQGLTPCWLQKASAFAYVLMRKRSSGKPRCFASRQTHPVMQCATWESDAKAATQQAGGRSNKIWPRQAVEQQTRESHRICR
jgi:hypothetical protein